MAVDGFRLSFAAPEDATLDLQFEDGYDVVLAVGLDGVTRVTDTRYGAIAATGTWLPRGLGLVTHVWLVGEAQVAYLTFRPRDGEMRVVWQDAVTGATEPMVALPVSGS